MNDRSGDAPSLPPGLARPDDRTRDRREPTLRPTRELTASLARGRAAFLGVAAMSGLINLLYLTGSFFMLEVYDRVIPGRSVPTLVGLSLLALGLYLFQGALDALRARILSRAGAALDADLGHRAFDLVVRAPLKGAAFHDGLAPIRDLDTVRSFFAGGAPGPCSICPGSRSISPSASCSTRSSAWPPCSAALSWSPSPWPRN